MSYSVIGDAIASVEIREDGLVDCNFHYPVDRGAEFKVYEHSAGPYMELIRDAIPFVEEMDAEYGFDDTLAWLKKAKKLLGEQ